MYNDNARDQHRALEMTPKITFEQTIEDEEEEALGERIFAEKW